MGDNLSQSAPQANFEFEFTQSSGDLVVTHDGGDSFTDKNTKNLIIQVAGTDHTWADDGSAPGNAVSTGYVNLNNNDVSAGDSATVTGVSSGQEVRVIWTSDNGQSSQTVAQYTA